jgi:hypothetical protein
VKTAAFAAPWLLTLASVFERAGQPLYAVGGAVRNALMDLPAIDVDVCGPATPEAVAALCEGTPVRAMLRAAHFGTVELHVADGAGRHMAEYTTFRMDSYRGGHQPSAVRFADSPAVDALRRDFSVNALYRRLYADPAAPAEVLDPTGGLIHLRQKVLHTVTPDPDHVLKDDGLRILRAARFQAELGFVPTPALLRSATKYAHLLREIAMERLRDELAKLVTADTRYPTLARTQPPIAAGLGTVLAVGAWPPLFGALYPHGAAISALDRYHPPQGAPPVAGKLALLFWHEAPEALMQRMLALRFGRRETVFAGDALRAMQAVAGGPLTCMAAVRLGVACLGHAAAALAALLQAGEPLAEASARAESLLAALQSGIPLSLGDLAIDGNALLPLCAARGLPARLVGQTLNALWQRTVDGGLPNEPQHLLAAARQLLDAANPAQHG